MYTSFQSVFLLHVSKQQIFVSNDGYVTWCSLSIYLVSLHLAVLAISDV